MSVKVLIKRKAEKKLQEQLKPLLLQLRAMAQQQAGYISGETLLNLDAPDEITVISIWKSQAEWECWLTCNQRRTVQAKIDEITGHPTYYDIYVNI